MNTLDSEAAPQENKIRGFKGLIQNRVTALSTIGIGATVYMHYGDASIILLWPLLATKFGTTTAKIYERTCHQIERFGCIDDRFFIQVIGGDYKYRAFGYCELQGMYLAAKKYGMEDGFFALKKEHTKNMIPNF